MRSAFTPYAAAIAVFLAALASCDGGETAGRSSSGGDGGGSLSTSASSGSGGSSGSTSSGSSGSTSSSSGGGQTGSGGGGPASCADLPLCDDFESAGAAPDPALWEIVSPNCGPNASSLTIDATTAHSGTKSVKVVGGGGYCDHIFFKNAAVLPTFNSPVYGRFFVRLSDPLGAGHTTFMAMRDANDAGGKDLRMGGQSQIAMWNRESDDATLPVLSPAGIAKSVAIPANTWTCVEFMVDGASRSLTTWINGAQVDGLVVDAAPTPDVDQTWLANAGWKPSLQDLKLGWESYAGQAMTLWFDDVALAQARVGCN